jgi:histidinol dehydrogenase
MRILEWNRLDALERAAALERPAQQSRAEVDEVVRAVIAAVRARGDAALREYTHRFDGVELRDLQVDEAEFAAARRALGTGERAALERAIENVERFHRAQSLEREKKV